MAGSGILFFFSAAGIQTRKPFLNQNVQHGLRIFKNYFALKNFVEWWLFYLTHSSGSILKYVDGRLNDWIWNPVFLSWAGIQYSLVFQVKIGRFNLWVALVHLLEILVFACLHGTVSKQVIHFIKWNAQTEIILSYADFILKVEVI